MRSVTQFAPAKLNLYLAITGRRKDGFHDLLSVVAQLEFGDTVRAEPAPGFSLRCSDPEVPVDEGNLVLRAARAFAKAAGWNGGAAFVLEKRIPMGAGMGGGSSDAVATLRALNELVETRYKLAPRTLASLAEELGSDCPLFLQSGPVILRGRGELVTPLPDEAAARIRGRRVLVFKPGFGVATPWAYSQLAAQAPGSYRPGREAEKQIRDWIEAADAPVEKLLSNGMEGPVFAKYLALPALFDRLESRFGLRPRMSGSGSACFLMVADHHDLPSVVAEIREAWGPSGFIVETRLT